MTCSGLQAQRSAILVLRCPPEHSIGNDAAPDAAILALESRALPVMTSGSDAGSALADCLKLDGNPAIAGTWRW